MPKINVYLPDDLATMVKRTGVAVSSICQQALTDAVNASDPVVPPSAGDALDGSGIGFTKRAHNMLIVATANGGDSVALANALFDGPGLVLSVLEALDVDGEDVRAELRARSRSVRETDPIKAVVERATARARVLQQHPVGTEHLLLGLTSGPADEFCTQTLISMGITDEKATIAVRAALAGYAYARDTTTLNGLSAPIRAAVEDIRSRLARLETAASITN